jgi:peptide/nickel transport system substrate-binding protein
MKKVIKYLISFLLTISTILIASSTDRFLNVEAMSEPYGTVVIGTHTFDGNMIEGFGNNAYDVIVRNMIWGYATYTTTMGGEIVLDTRVVKNVITSLDNAGNKTYTFELNTNLKWSDGTAITADDYVFSILLAASPEWRAVGAWSSVGRDLVGYTAYNNGSSEVFTGVKKLGTYSFSLTINANKVPYFYETIIVTAIPSPLHVWGQGVTIGTDGSSLTGDLATSALYVAETERFAPSVSSGPFKFVSNIDGRMTVKFNPEFVGDYRGNKAKLDTVVVQEIDTYLGVDYVIAGEVDIVTGVIDHYNINKALVSDQTDVINYNRNGYGLISFANDFGPTSDKYYRQAVAHLIDRQAFINTILGGYGTTVNSEYGHAQWMYNAKAAELEDVLVKYTFNANRANDLLDLTEWKFEADGITLWDRTKASDGYWRHNKNGVSLKHNHFGTYTPISDLISSEWPKGMNQAGIEFNIEYGDFGTFLSNYYVDDPDNRFFHSYNLATNFSIYYDPYFSLHSDFYGEYNVNPTGTNNPDIDRLTSAMRSLEPTQKEEYLDLWFEYQQVWNELLPVLPIYVNSYHDVFNVRVSGLATNALWTIGRAIIDVSVSYDSQGDALNLLAISVNSLPNKTSYLLGESLDLAGASLKLTFNDGATRIITISNNMVSGYDPYAPVYGPQTVTVSYGGKTTTFQVSLDRFSDVPYGHRNYTHINALVGLGIINGYSDNTFRPSNTLTRAQAAIMIVRAAGISTEGVSSNFTDVPPTHAAYKFISAAYQAGIINGYSDGTFRPNANVTRAQIAIMVQRAFNVQASETIITFTDVPEGYAPKKFIETLASQKIVNGYSDGTFKPLNNVTRAQFSTMIYNAIQYAQKQLAELR